MNVASWFNLWTKGVKNEELQVLLMCVEKQYLKHSLSPEFYSQEALFFLSRKGINR